MFDKIQKDAVAARILEESLYEQVVVELSQGQRRDGLWAKALAYSDGEEVKAKSLYIKYRVQSLIDEMEVNKTVTQIKEENECQEARARQKEKEIRAKACKRAIRAKGLSIVDKNNNGWIVYTMGGPKEINTLEELEKYAGV